MRVVVTGSAGLIGGIVYDRLLSDGHQVVGIDRPHDEWLSAGRNTEDSQAPERVDFHYDLAAATEQQWAESLKGCEVIVHLAADANPSNSDESMLRNNVGVTADVMRHARSAGVRRVILSSSGLVQVGLESELAEGGNLEGELLGVSHGTSTTSSYGESKVFSERIGQHYATKYGIQVIVVRIGTVIPDDAEHWRRGGRLQATAFLHSDVSEFFALAVSADFSDWEPNSCTGHPPVSGFLLTAAQSDSPERFVDLEPGVTALGWRPIAWPDAPENLQ